MAGGKVYFYIPNTSTPKNTYQDPQKSILNTNPIILDSRGEAIIWGDGAYRQVVRDADDNLIWDRVTQTADAGLTGNITDDVFVAGVDFTPGETTSLTLSVDPGTVENTWIFFDTAYQTDDQVESLQNKVLTFTSPIPEGVQEVTVKSGTTVGIGVPADGSVGDNKLVWGKTLLRVCDNIAQLRALPAPPYQRAHVMGYYEPGDGGGGEYWLDPDDNTTNDNGGTVIVGVNGARWKLQLFGAVSVCQFGVKADAGVTDNKDRLQAVRDWVAEEPLKNQVYFPSGTYGYSVSPNWAIQNAVIVGIGEVHLQYSGTDHAVIIDGTGQPHAGCYNNTFWNFTIDAPATAKNAALVKWSHHSQYKLKVRGAGSTWAGIEVYGCVCTNFESPEVSPNADGAWYQNAMPQYGMKFTGAVGGQASYNKISNPVMEGLAKPTVGAGIYLEGAFGNNFYGGTSEGCTIGIATATNTNGCLNNKFFGIDLEANTDNDIFEQGLGNEYHSVDTTKKVIVAASAITPRFFGGQHYAIEVAAGAVSPGFFGVVYNRTGVAGTGAFTNGEPSTQIRDCVDGKTGKAGPFPQTDVAIGASPWTYTNNKGREVMLSLTGGTMSSLQVVRNGVGTLISPSAQLIPLSPGDQLIVTYTGAPSVWEFTR